MKNMPLVAVAYYSREQWLRLKEIADDKKSLDKRYEDWLSGWHRFWKHSPYPKSCLIKVDVDVSELAGWCLARNRPLDSSARSEFVAEKIKTQDSIAPQ
ncbi:MAG: hypothetical protein K2X77_11965 [Candidatus Obscuribacterales bacterium]|jgi:hypothetical protein|nr:hypothetical protein [Candidatus Obscuribacterales bacterium]